MATVTALRHRLLHHRWLTLGLIVLTLLVRFAVPVGYMPVFAGNTVTIALCSGSGPMTMAMTGVAAMTGPARGDSASDHDPGGHGKAEMPCGFAGLSAPFVAGADPVVLALAVAFIVATVFRAVAPRARVVPANLRPPLRGPPATA